MLSVTVMVKCNITWFITWFCCKYTNSYIVVNIMQFVVFKRKPEVKKCSCLQTGTMLGIIREQVLHHLYQICLELNGNGHYGTEACIFWDTLSVIEPWWSEHFVKHAQWIVPQLSIRINYNGTWSILIQWLIGLW